jgi:hypothetical protein
MKTRYKLIIVSSICLVELCHYLRLSRRYNNFNRLRLPNIEPEKTRDMIRAIISKDEDLFERAQLHDNTSHIRNEDDVYDGVRIHDEQRPANQLQVGCAKIFWRYHPFAFEIMMKVIRQIGNMYMRYLGFSRAWHKTPDGWYSVWTHIVPGTKSLLFFPGLGLGAVPYAKYAKKFKRTVHMIEVPNMGYATPYSERHATIQTLYDVISEYGNDNDIFAHSLGSVHAAMWINENTLRNDATKYNAVICDGFVNPIDALRSHMYPFVNYCDYLNIKKKPRTRKEFDFFLWFATHNLEFNSWAKRYHNWYDGVLWRDYPNVKIKYIYSGNDILYDTKNIADKCGDSLCIDKGGHGSVLFGKQRDIVLAFIQQCINA